MKLSEKITKEDIKQLINEAVSGLGADWIYRESMKYLNVEAMRNESKNKPFTAEEIGTNFAVAGFMAGIEFALQNIQITDDD